MPGDHVLHGALAEGEGLLALGLWLAPTGARSV
jgi:hypothetical protein